MSKRQNRMAVDIRVQSSDTPPERKGTLIIRYLHSCPRTPSVCRLSGVKVESVVQLIDEPWAGRWCPNCGARLWCYKTEVK